MEVSSLAYRLKEGSKDVKSVLLQVQGGAADDGKLDQGNKQILESSLQLLVIALNDAENGSIKAWIELQKLGTVLIELKSKLQDLQMKFRDAAKDLPNTLAADKRILRGGVYGGCAVTIVPLFIPGLQWLALAAIPCYGAGAGIIEGAKIPAMEAEVRLAEQQLRRNAEEMGVFLGMTQAEIKEIKEQNERITPFRDTVNNVKNSVVNVFYPLAWMR